MAKGTHMNKTSIGLGLVSAAIVLSLTAITEPARATGIRIPEVSIAGLGTADALVANPKEVGAIPYNPAAMTFHREPIASPGLVLINPSLSVDPAGGSGSVDSDGRSIIPVPNVSLLYPANHDWAVGLNVNSPFGLETDWPDETFPAFGELVLGDPSTDVDAFEPALTKIEMININPNVSHRIHSINASIAVGVDFYHVTEGVLDTQSIGIDGDGTGTGWNAALMVVQGPVTLGVSYRSEVEVDIRGSFDASAIVPPGLGIPPKSSATTEVTFPDMLQVGVRYEVLPTLGLEFDVERTGWSSFDEIAISHSVPVVPSPYTEVSDWRDSTAYRFGATYMIIPALQLRLGYAFDVTPQTDGNFSARIPDGNRHSIHTGFAYHAGPWSVEGGYLYVKLEDRTISSATPYLGGDPNGTAAYNGKYDSYGHEFGLSFTWRFL
jgi:long-chain fatty acid transport protein